ncbi:MAG: alpha/beta fold hydrolase [Pseudomonadales bacterium]
MGNGARVHYRDEGRQDGHPIVLVHGAMASLHTWEPWVRILGERHRVITLDLPAHGLTGRVPHGAYGPDAFTRTIRAVTEELGIRSFVLGGNSMGGGATWRYALAYPEQVRAMILVDSVEPAGWRQEGGSDQGADRSGSPIGFQLLGQGWFRAIARYLDPRLLIDQGLRAAYNNSPVVDEVLIDRYYELIMRAGTRAAILERTQAFAGERRADADPSTLTQPTLVLWGAQDALIPVSVAREFEQRLQNAEVVIYDDLGHVPMEEDPERTAADVLRFLGSLPAADPEVIPVE